MAEFSACPGAGGPELGKTLGTHILGECSYRRLCPPVMHSLCQMPSRQAQGREELYMPRRMVPLDWEDLSCGDMCELDPEVQVGYHEAEREARTLCLGRMAGKDRVSSEDSWLVAGCHVERGTVVKMRLRGLVGH